MKPIFRKTLFFIILFSIFFSFLTFELGNFSISSSCFYFDLTKNYLVYKQIKIDQTDLEKCKDIFGLNNDYKKKNFCINKECSQIVNLQGSPINNLEVYPSTTINVGQEVFLDASGFLEADQSYYGARFEWIFGDGYELRWPLGGSGVTHTYIKPGTYELSLIVNQSNTISSINKTITVLGNDPKLPPLPAIQPVLEMKFENNLQDSSGNNLNGALVNGVENYVDGVENMALDFSNGAFVNISDINSKLGGTNQLTISFWAKKNNPNELNYLLDKKNSFSYYYSIYNHPSFPSIRFSVSTPQQSSITSYLVDGGDDTNWHHHVLIYNETNLKMYLDGVLKVEGNVNAGGNVNANNLPLLIGRNYEDNEVYNGAIDELKIYNKTLTEQELALGFEVLRSDFHARTAQYLYVQIPSKYTAVDSNRLKIIVQSDTGYSSTIIDKNNLQSEERILLNNSLLPVGNFTVNYKILNSANTVLDEFSDYFAKTYLGAPTVGINEQNSLVVDGELFFPVTPFAVGDHHLEEWTGNEPRGKWEWLSNPNSPVNTPYTYPRTNETNEVINSVYALGFWNANFPASLHTTGNDIINSTSWELYLNRAELFGLKAFGPNDFVGMGLESIIASRRNWKTSGLTEMVNAVRGRDSMIAWIWRDEPDLGSTTTAENIPPQVVRGWTYLTHKLDPNRPVMINYEGRAFVDDNAKGNLYSYMKNSAGFGARTHTADIIGFDYYPIGWANNDPGRIVKMADIIDDISRDTYNLAPIFSFIETIDLGEPLTVAPTPEQLKMLIWLNVVHGVKGINWFHYFEINPANSEVLNIRVMRDFLTQITDLKNIVLGPPSEISVTDNSNVLGNRVDTMIREDNEMIWLFAVRLTEIGNNGASTESNNLLTTFTVGESIEGLVDVYNESRSIPISNGVFTDTFRPNDVHIYILNLRNNNGGTNTGGSSAGSSSGGGSSGGSSSGGGSSGGTTGSTFIAQCNDDLDNDGDNLVDYPKDLGCSSIIDNIELDDNSLNVNGNNGESGSIEGGYESGFESKLNTIFWIALAILTIAISIVLVIIFRSIRKSKNLGSY